MEPPATLDDKIKIERSMDWKDRNLPSTLYQFLNERKKASGSKPAISFQILSDPQSKAETLTWNEFHEKVTQAANLFRSLGISETDVIAFILPNCTETAITLVGGAVAGIVNPINPLLDAEQIAGILNTSNAKVVVTLKSFPKTNIAQLAAQSVEKAPNVKHVLEIDICRHLSPPKSWLAKLLRPKNPINHSATVLDFHNSLVMQPSNKLNFEDSTSNRIAAFFHTGGTTGIPKLARHDYSGLIYNGWAGKTIGLESNDNIMCPLPLFHVFAAYPAMMSAIAAGSHIIFPTPAGYRGEGVFDNFWKLIERWKITYLLTVPTAGAALMQRPVNADISSLKTALCGSAPLPLELARRFEESLGIKILEGYGLTEATCLVSVNPLHGERKVGSTGLPIPYANVRILDCDENGNILHEYDQDEIGEICISSPGVLAGKTYVDAEKNHGLFAEEKWLRTGDLGKIDQDGYLWITGRAKDLIIRGGQNVDPAWIEEPLAGHDAIAFVGAVGQPDPKLGEKPCAFVELVTGASVKSSELMDYAQNKIDNRLAKPDHIEIMKELPKTAVGKVFKPALRKRAIERILNERLQKDNLMATVMEVNDDSKLGLIASISPSQEADKDKITKMLNEYSVNWRWSN